MPGLLGMIRVDGRKASIDSAVAKLLHSPAYRSKTLQPTQAISLGVICRSDSTHEYDWYADTQAQVSVLLNGTMISHSPHPHVMRAADVLSEYQNHGFTRWGQFEGGFLAVVVDLRQQKVFIVNDRLGMLPLYYAKTRDVFAFAPEAKGVLVNEGFKAQLAPSGVVNFLSAGYCFGDLTLFEDLHILEPCTLLSVHLRTLTLEKTRLWKMVYDPAPELLRRRPAEEALGQAIIAAHKTTLCDSPPYISVWVSGGWDSRGVLAALDRINLQANLALSWGMRDDIPHSDVFLARRLAEEFGIPFRFTVYDSETIAPHLARWSYLSEGVIDNFGWFVEGPEIIPQTLNAATEVVLVGDEAWGWGGYVANEKEAHAAVFPPEVGPRLRSIFEPAFAKEVDALYSAAIKSIADACDNTDFVDRKDFFYVHGRVARFIFPLRYFKEFTTPLRRPFLANGVLDVVQCLPSHYRMHKNLYISTLYHQFPRAMTIPVRRADSLPDWATDIRQKQSLRQPFLKLLEFQYLDQGPLGQYLHRSRFESLRDEFFRRTARPPSQRHSWSRVCKRRMERTIARSRWLSKGVHSLARARPNRSSSPSTFDILRRIALLALVQERLNDFTRPDLPGYISMPSHQSPL